MTKILGSILIFGSIGMLSIVLIAVLYLTVVTLVTIVAAVKNQSISSNEKIGWIIGCFLLGPFVALIYLSLKPKSKAIRFFHGGLFLVCALLLIAAPFWKSKLRSPRETLLTAPVARARQAEAKTTLMSLYSLQRSVFKSTGKYSADLSAMKSNLMGKSRYKVGFASANGANEATNSDRLGLEFSPEAPKEAFETLVAKYCSDCIVEDTRYKALAIGNIDNDETLDVWTIDHERNLINVVNDVEL